MYRSLSCYRDLSVSKYEIDLCRNCHYHIYILLYKIMVLSVYIVTVHIYIIRYI